MADLFHASGMQHGLLLTSQPSLTRVHLRPPSPTHQQHIRAQFELSPSGLESSSVQRANAPRKGRFSRMLRSKSRRNRDGRDSNLVKINLDEQPKGYPRSAVYLNSDKGAALFRRFGDAHSRILLYLQVEITRLEQKLKELDRDDDSKEETRWRVGHSIYLENGRENEARKDLIEELKAKLIEYDDLLLRDTQLRQLKRPSKRGHQNFFDWMWTENPFGEGEKSFIFHEQDFVVLDSQYEDSWLDGVMHRIMGHCRKGILRVSLSQQSLHCIYSHITQALFVNPDDQAKTSNPHVHYYSEDRMGTLIKVVVAIVSTALLFIPIFIFLSCHALSVKSMTAITLFFALVFATAISVFTSARRQEVFAATAAYCAVLVVFIGNLQQNAIAIKH
ncbi:uncharacterized protein PAC_17614 [Phialocephala subalpina]|uniref:DUF6594 domain-containing protein n=1 Tax=Phialocephala subalpina TaxID=576137 RepID=A0A1L7XRT2_9HELO|nr:uncharacterized protein PAC_17614 [Phialocephala subalpina]